MNYIKAIKQSMQVNGRDFLSYTCIPGVAGLVGILIMFIMYRNTDAYVTMGGMLAAILGPMVLLCNAFSLQGHFNLAVSMGKARKYFIPAEFVTSMAGTAAVAAVVILITQVETVLYPACIPGLEFEVNISRFVLNPVLLAAFILGVPIITMLIGALLMRFGAKMFWVVWVIWMAGFLVLPRIFAAAEKNPESWQGKIITSLANLFIGLGSVGMAILAIVLLAAGLIVVICLLRKQRVTS